MKRAAAVVMALCLALACAAAQGEAMEEQSGLAQAQPLTGEHAWPADSFGQACTLRYSYPQFQAESETDAAINAYYQALSRDMENLTEPVDALIGFEIEHNSSRYVSVVLTSTTFGGGGESVSLSADTFARDGLYAGQPVSLSQVLGLEEEGDELSDGESVAERGLRPGMAHRGARQPERRRGLSGRPYAGAGPRRFQPGIRLLPGRGRKRGLFIQPGEIAGEIAGVLRFPFAPPELLSAVKE